MLDTLQFIFSDFWYFLGTVILISVTGEAVAKIIRACRDLPEPDAKIAWPEQPPREINRLPD